MKVTLLSATPNPESVIEEAGRTCYLSKDRITETSAKAFITKAIARGHYSILEHASATFRVTGVSRAFTHQLVRHRLMSISQQSQRYVPEDSFEYVTPPAIAANPVAAELYQAHMIRVRDMYQTLRDLSILKEDARFVLPNACESEIVFTANFREYRHVFEVRIDPAAQWEIQMVCRSMLDQLYTLAPSVFADIYTREVDNHEKS